MDKRTLKDIHYQAMLAEHSSLEIRYDRKYEWRVWGYLEALLDTGMINDHDYLKIRRHYRKYFRELRRFIEIRNQTVWSSPRKMVTFMPMKVNRKKQKGEHKNERKDDNENTGFYSGRNGNF